jgi:2-dehydropantoate 2-reductase
MRYVVYGVGAIGGTIAARLALSGQEVAGIARGRHLEAIVAKGLTLRTPKETATVRFHCAADPGDLGLRDDDVFILAMKAQDTLGALHALRDAGAYEQPIVCAQNGVVNERLALRMFPNVYAMLIAMPGALPEPGEVHCFGGPKLGVLDIGRVPHGTDAFCATIGADLTAADFAARPDPDIMRRKYGKLVTNVANMVDASLGPAAVNGPYYQAARREAEAVLAAAGIEFTDPLADPELPTLMRRQPIEGVTKPGSSSWQSLARGTGSLETDYLNGEFVLLGRLHGVPTPVNEALCRIAQWMLRENVAPGTVGEATVDRFIEEARRRSSGG